MSRVSDNTIPKVISSALKFSLFFLVTVHFNPVPGLAQNSGHPANHSRFVYPGPDGRLVYEPTDYGDIIPDFSHAGYRGGGVALPDVPVRITLDPEPGDNTRRIQQALDRVGNRPLNENGLRGAVYLNAGTYEISGTLTMSRSGVALLGAGDHEGGTLLVATGKERRTLLEIEGEGELEEVSGTRRDIVDEYVPVGARSFTVEDAGDFSVGDPVIVYRPSTAEWISAIGMDDIPPNPGRPEALVQWTEGSRDIQFDRIITAIDDNTITVDAPLTHSLDQQYGGGYVFAYAFPGRLNEVGVGYLRAVTRWRGVLGLGRDRELEGYPTDFVRDFAEWQGGDRDNPPEEEYDRASRFVSFDAVENAWMTNVTVRHFGAGASSVGRAAKWVTIQDSRSLEPVSRLAGGGRYSFPMNGQLTLIQRVYATDGRHDFVTGVTTTGPNVYLNSIGDRSQAAAGPHQRYAVGTLYDNIKLIDSGGDHASTGGIEIRNRGPLGSGHGWCGANHVAWNAVARWIMIENPPLSQNWAIGSIETDPDSPRVPFNSENRPPSDDPPHGNGLWDSYGHHVEPGSLYLKQLEDRLGTEAVEAISNSNK
ncbi:MAG: hypothetical protein WD266_11910 [Balneolales bacterium]